MTRLDSFDTEHLELSAILCSAQHQAKQGIAGQRFGLNFEIFKAARILNWVDKLVEICFKIQLTKILDKRREGNLMRLFYQKPKNEGRKSEL